MQKHQTACAAEEKHIAEPLPGQRFLPNPYERDYRSIISDPYQMKNVALSTILPELESCFENRTIVSSRGRPISDTTIYTGLGGIAYTYLRLAQRGDGHSSASASSSSSSGYLRRARDLALLCLEDDHLHREGVAFFVGSPGCLAVACLSSALLGETKLCSRLWKKMLQLEETALQSEQEDELLFGRAGYIYSLLFVQSQLDHKNNNNSSSNEQDDGSVTAVNPIDGNGLNQVLRRVAKRIIASGRSQARTYGYDTKGWPLMFHFDDEPYLGSAHGLVGILKMLYHCWHVLDSLDKELVRQTMSQVLRCRFRSSGNLPVVLGETDDILIHWCHGCPGLPALLATAVSIDGDNENNNNNETWRSAALQAGEHIWRYGVLLKGDGLCHGIAGNAYAFLSLYRLTGDSIHLQRAQAFAKLIQNQTLQKIMSNQADPQRKVVGRPDSPQSLMEGSAGVLCFFLDLIEPKKANFPGWDL